MEPRQPRRSRSPGRPPRPPAAWHPHRVPPKIQLITGIAAVSVLSLLVIWLYSTGAVDQRRHPDGEQERVSEKARQSWVHPSAENRHHPHKPHGDGMSLPRLTLPQHRSSLRSRLSNLLPVHEEQLSPADFVVTVPGQRGSETLFAAGRAARLGSRTFLATSYQATREEPYEPGVNETWGFYPDDIPLRSWYPGDSRAAILPFLAFEMLEGQPPFKWLFYGDDDTVFFVDAAIEVVKHLDPSQPYFLTDNIWHSTGWDATYHPHPLAPRCFPCRGPHIPLGPITPMARACPCTPRQLCRGAGFRDWSIKGCREFAPYSMHGGAGALVSIGLLRRLRFDVMDACIQRQHDSGGDAFLSTCLWEHDVGLTSPDPVPHPLGHTAFDPSPGPLHPDDYTLYKAAHVLGNMLRRASGYCTGLCRMELQHTVSLHLRSRHTGGSQRGSAAFVRLFSRFASALGHRLPANLAAVGATDTTDVASAAVAARLDSAVATGIQTAGLLTSQVEEAVREANQGELEMLTASGLVLSMEDRVLAAAGYAVADQLLRTAMGVVKPLAEDGLLFHLEPCGGEPPQPTNWLRDWFFNG